MSSVFVRHRGITFKIWKNAPLRWSRFMIARAVRRAGSAIERAGYQAEDAALTELRRGVQ